MTTDDDVVIRPRNGNQPRAQSAYMSLLNSLATDLDLMLNDLRSTPPRFIQPRASFPIFPSTQNLSLGTCLQQSQQLKLGLVDSEHGNVIDNDLNILLPGTREKSTENLSKSRTSLVSSSDGGVLAEGETSSSGTATDTSNPPCDLGSYERLSLTHPVWFLPGIQRAGAVHLLQGKDEGNFVVRGSSQTNTMAISVRLPDGTGPYIEHYLIISENGVLSLESSRFEFNSIPALIDHYAKCCDELPVQLSLPKALREASNRQQLSSLALLGQEFWRYPMANSRSADDNIPTPVSLTSKTESSGIGTTVFSGQHQKVLSQQTIGSGNVFSRSSSSLSSFTSTGQQILSPESIDSIAITMSPVGNTSQTGIIGKTSTFMQHQKRDSIDFEEHSNILANCVNCNTNKLECTSQAHKSDENCQIQNHQIRPTPPNSLNLRIPPAPPRRWTKRSVSPHDGQTPLTNRSIANSNFTVTTTVTFSMQTQDHHLKSQLNTDVSTMNPKNEFQNISKRLSPEGECKTSANTNSSESLKRWQDDPGKESSQNIRSVLSPNSETSSTRLKRSRSRNISNHYQESDILVSPQVYCRSNLGDKISDYEDLWAQETCGSQIFSKGALLSNFRPKSKPDFISETPNHNSPSSDNNLNKDIMPKNNSPMSSIEDTVILRQSNDSQHDQNNILRNDQFQAFSLETNRLHISLGTDQKKILQQPRNRLGVLLTSAVEFPSLIGEFTPIQNCKKQGSPFYAEPADAIANVLRRSRRSSPIPKSQRHSEPFKSPFLISQFAKIPSPVNSEKYNLISGSLDELKNKVCAKPPSGRTDLWPVDSSWEFMGTNDHHDYDTDTNWTFADDKDHVECSNNKEKNTPFYNRDEVVYNPTNKMTINQIIAERLPDLKIPELLQKTLLPTNTENPRQHTMMTSSNKRNRLSAYDNVERARHSGYATSMNYQCSSHSDDGTVFSEPWDSSQWDSSIPYDDNQSGSIRLSKCRPAICNSEDDTILENSAAQNRVKDVCLHNNTQQLKVATILRSRSCRDREILRHPRNKANSNGPGDSISAYALTLAQDSTTTFSRNIENFISCTRESREPSPQIAMRNMRQFMSGMKNYLVKHGEGDFQRKVLRARSMLKPDEFLNLDTILESVMHQLVVLPLREHLYGLFVDFYTSSGDIQLLVENVKHAFGRGPADFGIRSCIQTPSPSAMQQISLLILRLQEAELPLAKLEILLSIVSSIIESTANSHGQALGADDFLPLLVYVVAKCGFVGAEIEAEFMWCLLQPSLLNGEAGYYLTALCSAVHVLKSFVNNEPAGSGSLDFQSSSLPACSSVLRVIIPDEYNGSLQARTLPIRPHTTTREVCRIIAHKAGVTNPQDYGLFKLVDGEETILLDSECPQEARLAARGRPCMLAYKRIDAKIAWPTTPQAFQ